MNLCPRCHVDRNTVFDMFLEPAYTDNHALAVAILNNCGDCNDYMRDMVAVQVWLDEQMQEARP